MICITIIILALVIGAVILGWKSLSRDYAIEAAQDVQLDDISIIVGKIIDKYNKWHDSDDKDYKYKPNDDELEMIIRDVYTISTRGYQHDNNK